MNILIQAARNIAAVITGKNAEQAAALEQDYAAAIAAAKKALDNALENATR